jgi:DNA-binding response OmpR family regulator
MAKILIVDDEQHIIELVTLYLEHEGYQVTGVGTGEAARTALQDGIFDLVILDLMLPDVDGFAMCGEIRSKSDVPILMLTARKEDVDKIVGLEIGADDYLTKPFNPRELVARVRAILRRHQVGSKATDVIEIGKLRIDLSRHEVAVAGSPITLRSKEFALLATLAQNLGIVFSREKLLEIVWGYDYFGETRTVDVHINHLREKLAGSGIEIKTIRGTGYKMKVGGNENEDQR